MKREEIIEKIAMLEEMLFEIDEDEEQLEEVRRNAKLSAKTLKIMIEEYEKQGFDANMAVELVKIGLGGNK